MSGLTSEQLTALGMMSLGEVALLKRCAKMLPENPIVVNIGAGVGTSTLAVLETRPDAFIFSVDKNAEPREQKSLMEAGKWKEGRLVRVLGDSKRVGRNWPLTAHMTFVDGDHTDAGCQGDIDAWLPKTSHIILFHDYAHKNVPGLVPLIDAAMAKAGAEEIGRSRYLIAFKLP